MLISLITTLETYIKKAFERLAYNNTIGEIKEKIEIEESEEIEECKIKKLRKLFNVIGINIDINYVNLKALEEIRLYNLLPKRIDFQQKNKTRSAFLFFNIDLNVVNHKLWQRIFSKEKNSYIHLRNAIIHGGAEETLFRQKTIDIEIVESCYRDIAEFVHLMDQKIIQKYPNIYHR